MMPQIQSFVRDGGWWCCGAEFGEHEISCPNHPDYAESLRKIELPCYGIKVTLGGTGAGSIISDMHEQGGGDDWGSGVDGIEALILAHACAGIDITAPAYVQGIQTAVEACGNNQ